MKIHDLEIDRFGVWSGLKLENLSDRLTVFYGPNEAGKTTLMQFVRGVLYGFDEPGRSKYLSALAGDKAGGALHVHSSLGEFRLHRAAHAEGSAAGTLTVAGRDGLLQSEPTLQALLGDIDEPIFNNVFAVGLREIQELATLTDTEAASLLYSLSSGLDRVSLLDVIRELESSRNRLLAPDDRPCIATQLITQRDRLRGEIEELRGATLRWDQLQGQSEQLLAQLTRFEEENADLERETRRLDTALAVRTPWRRRVQLVEQLDALGAGQSMPADALELLTRYNTKLAHRRRQRKVLFTKRRALRDEACELQLRPELWRQAPRIEALADQQPWIESLETQIQTLEGEVNELQTRRAALRDQLSTSGGGVFTEPPLVSAKAMAMLKPHARALRQGKEALQRAIQENSTSRDAAQTLETRIHTGLAEREEATLAEALEVVGNRAGLLRRRVNLDERLDQMQRHRTELEQQSLESLDRQLLPINLLTGIGVVFVLGIVLILANIWAPSAALGVFGWMFAGLGVCVTGFAGLWKLILDKAAANKLISCNQQIELLEKQIAQALEEREMLDRELPRGGGPLAARLQTAERELAALEELLPLDAQRQAALQEATAAEQRIERLRGELKTVHDGWREALVRSGLPSNLTPRQLKQLAGQRAQTSEIQQRLERAGEELEQRRREYRGVAERAARLIAEVQFDAGEAPLVEQVGLLVGAAREQEQKMARRTELKRAWRKLKRLDGRYTRSVKLLRRKRQALLQQAGVQTEEQYRGRVEAWRRIDALRQEQSAVGREITAALAGRHTESEIEPYLASDQEPHLESRWEQVSGRLEANQLQLKRLLEQRGELGAQLKTLTEDRRLTERQVELGAVEKRLEEAVDDWQVRAITGKLLESLRKEIEEHRQPETLLEASIYLHRLTAGHYARVWTPMDQDVLFVEDQNGRCWTVDLLSSGAREQLFVALRLALVALYARRGVQLPVVLDDVLVNFDHIRSRAAAELFRDFAKAGHQLLVFTCHEHVWKMFELLKADARRLPSRDGQQELLVDDEPEETAAAPEIEIVAAAAPPQSIEVDYEVEAPEEVVIDELYEYEEELVEHDEEAEEEILLEEAIEVDEAKVEPEVVLPDPPEVKPQRRGRRLGTGPFGWDVELEEEAEAA